MDNLPIIITDQIKVILRKHIWKRLPNQCWIWTGGRDDDGYGRFNIYKEDGKTERHYKAHRVAYVKEYGEFDWNLQVCHKCDIPPCCNPIHLWIGTNLENQQDSGSKGRTIRSKGEDHGMTHLTEDDIRKIRFKCALGISQENVGREFDIDQTTVSLIVRFKLWAHVV